MNDPVQSQPVSEPIIQGSVISAVPTEDVFGYAPHDPIKRKINSKIFGTVLGVLLLIGGLATGVVLVSQRQLLEQNAQTVAVTYTYPDCPTGITTGCDLNPVMGGSACFNREGGNNLYCCPEGHGILNGYCSTLPGCEISKVQCNFRQAEGSSQCIYGDEISYCCPSGQSIVNNKCVKLPALLCSDPSLSTSCLQAVDGPAPYFSKTCTDLNKDVSADFYPTAEYCCPKGWKLNSTSKYCYKPK